MYVDTKQIIWTRTELTEEEYNTITKLLHQNSNIVSPEIYNIINSNSCTYLENTLENLYEDADNTVIEVFNDYFEKVATGHMNTGQKYVLVTFPDIQYFMVRDRWEECIFVNNDDLPDSSYMVPEDLYNLIMNS